jgi:hypothetical protein
MIFASQEREAAAELFGKAGSPSPELEAVMRNQEQSLEQNGDVAPAAAEAPVPSTAEMAAIQEAIKNAKSLDEIKRLEAQLEAGGAPTG